MEVEPKSPSKIKLSIMGFTRYKRVMRICIVSLVILLLLAGGYFTFEPSKARDLDARHVLDDVEHVPKEHTFVSRRSWIRVLGGKEEAYYGWVALNYKMGNLGNSLQGPTLGLLDLGGSSLQVVVEVHDGARDNMHLIRTKIGSVGHQILAYSLPSVGLNEAFDRTVAMLRQHPCLRSDFLQNYTCYACNGPNIIHKKNLGGQSHKSEYIYLVGDPDWEQCKVIARAAALNLSSSDWSQPTVRTNWKARLSSYNGCSILNLTAYPTGRFHALSGFFAIYNTLDLVPRANLTKTWERGEQLCSQSWGDSSNISRNQNYFGQYCFRVPYVASLLEDALCLGGKEIVFAALVEGEYLWLSISKTSISSLKIMDVMYSPILVFLLLTSLLFIVYCSQIKLPMLGNKVPTVGPSLPSYLYPKSRPN
ncbi:hypothetical protein P3X46_030957 [Hevea brasiliensis]|uniref:Apyrase n=1 Tax=Hevea brasiliensis TaxID=3981 RepID=A0ABQ9KLP5_HEVBR|nr:hypothetical protein P3X46_030957 [Hevea brasiliensis]